MDYFTKTTPKIDWKWMFVVGVLIVSLIASKTSASEKATTQFRRLLVSLDGSESAESVLPYVRAMAKTFDSKVVLLADPEFKPNRSVGEIPDKCHEGFY